MIARLPPRARDALEWLCATPPVVLLFLVASFAEPLFNKDLR